MQSIIVIALSGFKHCTTHSQSDKYHQLRYPQSLLHFTNSLLITTVTTALQFQTSGYLVVGPIPERTNIYLKLVIWKGKMFQYGFESTAMNDPI